MTTSNLNKGLTSGTVDINKFSDNYAKQLNNLPTSKAASGVDDLARALKGLDTSGLETKPDSTVKSVDSLASSVLPLASQIQSGIGSAMTTLQTSLRSMMGTLSKQLDAQLKFTKLEASIGNIREQWKQNLDGMVSDKVSFDAKVTKAPKVQVASLANAPKMSSATSKKAPYRDPTTGKFAKAPKGWNAPTMPSALTSPTTVSAPKPLKPVKVTPRVSAPAMQGQGMPLDQRYQGFQNRANRILNTPFFGTGRHNNAKGVNQIGKGDDTGKAAQGVTSVGKATDAVTGSLKNMGSQVALAFGAFAITYKAVEWIKGGVKSAADLGETVSKVKVVFGTSSDSIIKDSEKLAKSFGLPKQAVLDASSSFGLIAKASGKDAKGAADLASNLTKLAADASSFYNIPLDAALEKIRSGLVGEAEPMRSLGVLLSEDAVKTEALRMGLVKTGDDLSESAKVTARASLITRGLSDANGDLERTQGSAANQMRKFTGTMENLATSVGGVFLPALEAGMNVLNDVVTYLGKSFDDNKATIDGWGASLVGVVDVVGVAWRNLGDLWTITSLTAIQGIANIMDWFSVLGPNAVKIGEYIANNWTKLFTDMVNADVAILQNLWKNFTAIGSAIIKWLQDPTQGIQIEWTGLLDGFKATADALPELMKPALTDMSKEIDEAAQRIADREAKRAEAMKPKGPDKKGVVNPFIPDPDKKTKDKRPRKEETLSEALVVGSKDAYSQFANAVSGGNTALARHAASTARNTATIAKNTQNLAAAIANKPPMKVAVLGGKAG